MVVVKQKGKIRLCIDPTGVSNFPVLFYDPTDLNRNVKQRHYPLFTLEEIAARLRGSKVFTLLDLRVLGTSRPNFKTEHRYRSTSGCPGNLKLGML